MVIVGPLTVGLRLKVRLFIDRDVVGERTSVGVTLRFSAKDGPRIHIGLAGQGSGLGEDGRGAWIG